MILEGLCHKCLLSCHVLHFQTVGKGWILLIANLVSGGAKAARMMTSSAWWRKQWHPGLSVSRPCWYFLLPLSQQVRNFFQMRTMLSVPSKRINLMVIVGRNYVWYGLPWNMTSLICTEPLRGMNSCYVIHVLYLLLDKFLSWVFYGMHRPTSRTGMPLNWGLDRSHESRTSLRSCFIGVATKGRWKSKSPEFASYCKPKFWIPGSRLPLIFCDNCDPLIVSRWDFAERVSISWG